MASDAVVGAAAAPPPRARSLGRHATLNAVASLVDYGARGVVNLLITPVLVSSLGRSLYGVWEMLNRLIGYMSAADGRPTEALRLVVANRQGAGADDAAKRRYVGATLVVWVLALPVVALAGLGLVWIAPLLTRVPPSLVRAVELACALLVGGFLAATLASVPESVLRGMNLGYKRMGVQAGVSVVAGLLAVLAVTAGYGLIGLAGAYVVRAVLTGVCFWVLVKAYVSWFGVSRPAKQEVTGLLAMSVWLMAGDAIAKLLLASDVLILGAVVSPALVTTYALTGFAARTALGTHALVASSAMPGLGGLIGKGELPRASAARGELLTLTWLFAVSVGATVLLWNRSFVGLWVGLEHYAGVWIDLLIVVATLQSAFIRTDAYIIDAALQPRARTTVGVLAAVVTIGAGLALTRAWGLPGLCVSIIAGRAVQSVAYPLLAHKHLGRAPLLDHLAGLRFVIVGAALLGGSLVLGQRILAPTWIVFGGGVMASGAAIGALALLVGPSAARRRAVVGRIASLLPGRRGA